jgi:tRNA dimethylallyltransferase
MTEAADAPPDAILLLGPTASGKSALAMALARQLPLEIVSVDSAQVYRGMDIGTAKPTREERAEVPHHLIDLRDPAQPYSAADFLRDATDAIAAIRARGRLALVVGGTMLYARALRSGLSDLPPADAGLRARLSAQAQRDGWPAMHAALARVDAATAARLPPNDSQRIQRALEVFELTGVPLSQLQRGPRPSALALRTIALLPADRSAMHARIAQRFDAMLAAGLLDEVRALMRRGDLSADLPSQRSVGYRQAWEHLQGRTDAPMFRATALQATRQLAKRQMTWLRSMHDALALDPLEPSTVQALRSVVEAALP